MRYKIISGSKNEKIKVDKEDFELVSKYNWNCYSGYALTFNRRKENNYKLKSKSMHRLILQPKGKEQIDHINGNRLDNRKHNLRICTVQQNSCNRKKAKNSNSKYLGVTFHKRDNRWQAQIRTNKKRIYLGYFITEKEAAEAYNDAAIKYHKEFAKINKI